jgi:hypothetical protein
MRYADSSVVSDWERIFSHKLPETVKPETGFPVKTAKKTPVKKNRETPETKTLVFIKKEPVAFRFNRRENPGEFERMAFVVKACAKDPKRECLAVLHVEQTGTGSRLVATDGLRLHVAETSLKIKAGDYKPVVARDCISLGKPEKDTAFPNWRKVVPESVRKRGMINLEDAGMGKDRNQTERLSVAFNSFVRQTGELVNLRHIEDLTKKTWSIHCQAEKRKAIVLKEQGAKTDTFAVIMPLQETEAAAKAA